MDRKEEPGNYVEDDSGEGEVRIVSRILSPKESRDLPDVSQQEVDDLLEVVLREFEVKPDD